MDFDEYYNLLKAKIEAKDYGQEQEMPKDRPKKERKLRQNEIFYSEKNKKVTK